LFGAFPVGYWADIATVVGSTQDLQTTEFPNGDERIDDYQNIDLRGGIGLDIGFSWKSAEEDWGWAISYARGSGEVSGDERKHFIQPSISDNKGKIFGESRYRLYGELVNPELTNLQIISGFSGWRLTDQFWLEAAYHYYRQLEANDELSASALLGSPNGRDKDIGQELDLVLAGQWDDTQQLQLILSGFAGGSAFDDVTDSRQAYRVLLEYRRAW
jgi:hypothetical protein